MLRICYANIKNIPYIQQQNPKYSVEHEIGIRIIKWGCQFFWNYFEPMVFSTNEHGKPFLVHRPDIFFNVSHSGDYIVVAFSDQPIGVDIQKYGQKAHIELAERFFHPLEIKRLHSNPADIHIFYDIWAAKECYVKYLGCGLAGGLDVFHVDIQVNKCFIHDSLRKNPFLQQLTIDNNYAAFVCSEFEETIQLLDVSKKIG